MKRNHENWLTAYAHHTRHSESPDLFHFWTGVSTIAGALRRQVWIDQRYFQWTPNFYVILVGPPGIAAKSTSAGIGLDILEQVEGVVLGPDSMTWQGLTGAFVEAKQLIPHGDEGDYLPMSCITCSVSELGTFLRPDDKELITLLIDLWDGKSRSWRRRTQSMEGRVEIENPWINILGCTTPSWLKDNFTETMLGGGLVSRIVFIYADQKRQFVAYPALRINQQEYEDETTRLAEDLNIIGQLCGEYKLSKEAIEWGTSWYKRLWSKRPDHMISEHYSGYIARKQTHIHKLAIVLAAAQRDELIITDQDLIIANQMMTGLEASMSKVFESIGASDTNKNVQELLVYVRAFGEISRQEAWRKLMPIMDVKQFQEASDAAVSAGYMKVQQVGVQIFYKAVKQTKKEKE